MKRKNIFLLLIISFFGIKTAIMQSPPTLEDADSTYNTQSVNAAGATAADVIEVLFNTGASTPYSAEVLVGNTAVGFVNDFDTLTNPTIGTFSTGIVMSSGSADIMPLTNTAGGYTTTGSNISDPDFGANAFDSATLEFTINAPAGGVFSGTLVFASEEYPEYSTNSTYNDAARVFVNGVNYALAADGRPVETNAINNANNTAQYVQNTSFNAEPDGFTVPINFSAPLNAGNNTIKIGVSNRGDSGYNNWAWFPENSFVITTPPVDVSKNITEIYRDDTAIGTTGPVRTGDVIEWTLNYNTSGTNIPIYDIFEPLAFTFLTTGSYISDPPNQNILEDVDSDGDNENVLEYLVTGTGAVTIFTEVAL